MSHRLVIHAGGVPREFVLVDRLVVGRDPMCDVSDQDPLLSRRHAEFAETISGVVVRDLGSRNGILVNGVKQPHALLKSGDVVQIGHLQVRLLEEAGPFRIDPPAAATPPPRAATLSPAPPRPGAEAPPAEPAEDAAPTVVQPVAGGADPPRPGPLPPALAATGNDAPTIGFFGPDAVSGSRQAAERLAEEEANTVRKRDPGATDVVAGTVLLGGRWFAIVEYLLPRADGPERVRQFAVATSSGVARLTCCARAAEFAMFDVVLASAAPTKGSGTSP